MSKDIAETGCRGPSRGSLAFTGARPWDGRAPASARLGHSRPTWPSSPVGGLGGRPCVVGSLFRFSFSVDRLVFAFEILRGMSMLFGPRAYQEGALLVMRVWPLVALDLVIVWVSCEG